MRSSKRRGPAASTSRRPTRSACRRGPSAGACSRGEAIALDDGTVITPDQVLGAPRAGRKVSITGDTAPSLGYIELAQDAELLVHEATFCEDERERARETSHSTAREARRSRRPRVCACSR